MIFFTNIGHQLAENIPFQEFSDKYLTQTFDNSFKFPHITPEFVSEQLRKIPINKATGNALPLNTVENHVPPDWWYITTRYFSYKT